MSPFWCLLLICSGWNRCAEAQFRAVSFEHFTVDDGLTHSSIYSILQTPDGFLWFGTEDGLNRFDGYQFEQFFHNPNKHGSLTNSNISTMVAESDTTIWFGTWGGGINIFNTKTNRFSSFQPDSSINALLRVSRIQTLFVDKTGTIWAGTFENGVFAFNRKNNSFLNFRHDPSSENSLSHNRIWSLAEDSTGRIWCATSAGISIIETKTGSVERKSIPGASSGQEVRAILADRNGRLWMGTASKGIFISNGNTFEAFEPFQRGFKPIVNQIFQDSEGNIWIASQEDGVHQFDGKLNLINHFTYNAAFGGSLNNNDVRHILEDESGIIWLGTRGGGLAKFDKRKLRFGHHYVAPQHFNNPLYNRSWAVYKTADNYFFIGTELGLRVFKPNFEPNTDKTLIRWSIDDPNALKIRSISEDPDGFMWIGTSGDGIYRGKVRGTPFSRVPIQSKSDHDLFQRVRQISFKGDRVLAASFSGLLEYQKDKNVFVPIKTELIRAQVRAIELDNEGNFWVATHQGVFVLDKHLEFKKQFVHLPHDKNSLSFNSATSVLQAKNGFIWIGTDQGLNQYDPGSETMRWYFRTDGLANHSIHALIEDQNGKIWGTTNMGTFQLDPATGEIRNYDVSVGLQSNIFSPGSAFINSTGEILMGGNAGINVFHPDSIILSSYQPPIAITSVKVFDEPRTLSTDENAIPRLKLSYFENFVSFDVVSLDFANPRRNQYAYRLIGLDDNWVQAGELRHISYTNLNPGSYTLEIQGSNQDGIWSSRIARVSLVITPPFWQTLWFKTLLALAFTGVVGGALFRYIHSLRRKNKTLKGRIIESDQEIQEKDELFKLITENAADWIVVIEPDGTIEYCSPAVNRMLQLNDAELVGTNIAKVLHPKEENRFFETLKNALEQGEIIDRDVSFINKEHKERIFQLSGSPIQRRNSQSKRMLLIAHDITNLKETERNLKRAKIEADRANNSKSAFLAGMSHELRTPLNAILGFTQILGNDSGLSQKHKNFVDILHRSGKHLLSMINDVLDLSKIEAGKMDAHMEEVDLSTILQDIRSIFSFQAREKNISFTTDILGTLPERIESDGNKIRQILINFLGNAIKFTESGGILVTVAYKETPPKEDVILSEGYVKIPILQKALQSKPPETISGYLTFAVADSGHGIPVNQLTEVFKPFRQTGHSHARAAGTGLGLAICRSLVQLLGGTLYVKSKVGTGSTFAFVIPVKTIEASGRKEAGTAQVVGIKGDRKKSVLVLDDIETNVLLLTELLQPVGFECICASSGEEAITLFEQHNPDILLFDLRLPGISGEETLQRIRTTEKGKETPAIAVTASVLDESKEAVLSAGFASFIHKPFRVQELFSEIARVSGIEFITSSDSDKASSDLGIQMSQLADALASLELENKAELIDAIELTDYQHLSAFLPLLPKTLPFELLANFVKEQDLKSLLTLTEMLEKRNLV